MKSLMLKLFTLAYKSRVSIPLLLSVAFLLTDFHVRAELQIEARLRDEQENNGGEEEEEL